MRYHLTSLGIDVRFAPTADTGALIEAIVPGTRWSGWSRRPIPC
jgi:hypothetical protein